MQRSFEVRSVEGFLRGEYDGGLVHLKDQFLRCVKGILLAIHEFEKDEPAKNSYRFVMQKDLFSIAILFEYGGYFFDTNTKFLRPGLLPLGEHPKLPCLVDRYMEMPDLGEEYDKVTVFDEIDIWAIYSPEANHEFLKAVLEALIELNSRDFNIATNTVIMHIFSTLYKDQPVESFLWQATRTPEADEARKVWDLPELGMQKINAGSWRDKSLDFPSASVAVRAGEDALLFGKDELHKIGTLGGAGGPSPDDLSSV